MLVLNNEVKRNQCTVKNVHHHVLFMPFLQILAPSTENLYSSTAPRGLSLQSAL